MCSKNCVEVGKIATKGVSQLDSTKLDFRPASLSLHHQFLVLLVLRIGITIAFIVVIVVRIVIIIVIIVVTDCQSSWPGPGQHHDPKSHPSSVTSLAATSTLPLQSALLLHVISSVKMT